MKLIRALLLCAAVPCAVEAQVALHGRLLSAAGEPIPGASITLGGIGYSVRSDSSGRFVLSGQPGSTMVLYFNAANYRRDSAAVVLARRGSLERDFTLQDASAPDPEANLSATMLRGRVLEESGAPLSYANVQVNYGQRYVADDSGRFQLPYPAKGSITMIVRRIGFAPVDIRLSSKPDTALRVVLAAIPAQLKEVTVTAASAYRSLDIHGFYRRVRDAERGINHGYFITPEDIERRKPYATAVMADGFPSVRVLRSPLGPMWDRILGPRDCAMNVYVDNIKVTNRPQGGDDPVNQFVPVGNMAAMEIYPRLINAPPQYQTTNVNCGVILIWTK